MERLAFRYDIGIKIYSDEAYVDYTVKIKCAYHTNGILYGTVGVLITLIKV